MSTDDSLLISEELVDLYNSARAPSALEHATVGFWNHLISKSIFQSHKWMVLPEAPPVDGRRRVDLTVRFRDPQGHHIALLFIECKRQEAQAGEYERVDEQARKACVEYLQSNSQTHIYALTTVGTQGRLWQMFNTSGLAEQQMTAIFGDSTPGQQEWYIDAHYNSKPLKDGFEEIKSDLPKSMDATAAPVPYWTWDERYQQYFHQNEDGTYTWSSG